MSSLKNHNHGETIVKLHKARAEEAPLILLHGGEGNILSFGPLQKKFTTALWAIQLTPSTPTSSLDAQVAYYHAKIKEQLPQGPYRLASFSGSSIILLPLVRLFESHGDSIAQLAFIDNFPTIHFAPTCGLHVPRTHPDARAILAQGLLDITQDITRRDAGGKDVKRHQVADDMLLAMRNDERASPFGKAFVASVRQVADRVFDFMAPFTELELFEAWIREIKTRNVTMYVASDGILARLDKEGCREDWYGFGIQRCFPGAEVVEIHGGHFESLGSDVLVKGLQRDFRPPLNRL